MSVTHHVSAQNTLNLRKSFSVLVEKSCPVCGFKMELRQKCCGNPYSMLRCKCGYKEIEGGLNVSENSNAGDSNRSPG